MGFKMFTLSSIIGISFLAALAFGQDSNCEQATAENFDFQHSPEDGFTIYWTTPSEDYVTFMLEYDQMAYVSVGFSPTGSMVGSDAVMCLIEEEEQVAEYDLTEKSEPGVILYTTSDIVNGTMTQEDDTTCLFTRRTTPEDEDKLTISTSEGEDMYLIWALGPDNEFAYHEMTLRGSFDVDLFCPTASEALESESPTPSPDDSGATRVTRGVNFGVVVLSGALAFALARVPTA